MGIPTEMREWRSIQKVKEYEQSLDHSPERIERLFRFADRLPDDHYFPGTERVFHLVVQQQQCVPDRTSRSTGIFQHQFLDLVFLYTGDYHAVPGGGKPFRNHRTSQYQGLDALAVLIADIFILPPAGSARDCLYSAVLLERVLPGEY